MQAYPSRHNWVTEALLHRISPRQLRLMCEQLPPGNPVQRELNTPWNELEYLVHDVSSNLRALRADVQNALRERGAAPAKPEFLPTPETVKGDADQRSPEQQQAEYDHLKAVLNRPNPH